jgi:hypothetical protein
VASVTRISRQTLAAASPASVTRISRQTLAAASPASVTRISRQVIISAPYIGGQCIMGTFVGVFSSGGTGKIGGGNS